MEYPLQRVTLVWPYPVLGEHVGRRPVRRVTVERGDASARRSVVQSQSVVRSRSEQVRIVMRRVQSLKASQYCLTV